MTAAARSSMPRSVAAAETSSPFRIDPSAKARALFMRIPSLSEAPEVPARAGPPRRPRCSRVALKQAMLEHRGVFVV